MTYDTKYNKQLFLSLGSNLGDRKKNILNAVDLLEGELKQNIIISPFYESEALGFESEKKFLNICAKTKTNIRPEQLLKKIHQIEKKLGRIRVENSGYADRLIDIDILFYGQEIINTKKLKIPHHKIYERKFVLIPLLNIATDLIDPSTKQDITSLIIACNDKSKLTLHKD